MRTLIITRRQLRRLVFEETRRLVETAANLPPREMVIDAIEAFIDARRRPKARQRRWAALKAYADQIRAAGADERDVDMMLQHAHDARSVDDDRNYYDLAVERLDEILASLT